MSEHATAPATKDWCLYGLFRTDMESMNPGKGFAQAMHCGKHADFAIARKERFGAEWLARYREWEAETEQGFGTSLTLDVGTGDRLRQVVAFAEAAGFPAGVTHDPTYPVLDGRVVHLVPVDTCGWIFGSRAALKAMLDQYGLHP